MCGRFPQVGQSQRQFFLLMLLFDVYFWIQSRVGVDGLAGQVRPVSCRLMVTALYGVHGWNAQFYLWTNPTSCVFMFVCCLTSETATTTTPRRAHAVPGWLSANRTRCERRRNSAEHQVTILGVTAPLVSFVFLCEQKCLLVHDEAGY